MNDAPKRSLPEDVTATSEVAAGAVLTIDLGAIRENYRRLKARLGDVRCAVVLKADGYGVGASQVAAALLREGGRALPLKVRHGWYEVPIATPAWSDEAMVELTFADAATDPVPVTVTGTAGETPRTAP